MGQGSRSQRKVKRWGQEDSTREFQKQLAGQAMEYPRISTMWLWWLDCSTDRVTYLSHKCRTQPKKKKKATYFVQTPPVHLPLPLWESPEVCESGWSRLMPPTSRAWGWACWWCGWGRSEENLPPGSGETMQVINLFFPRKCHSNTSVKC